MSKPCVGCGDLEYFWHNCPRCNKTPKPSPMSFIDPPSKPVKHLYSKRQCCEQTTQPWAPPPQSPPILFCDQPYKTYERKYPVDRPFRDIFGSQAKRRTAKQSLLDVISLFKSVARVDILKWCSKQNIYSRCSLNTIFDIVCANPHAEVPETYYTAIKALESQGCKTFDMDIIPFSQIMPLWKKKI
jgi:hypothetical protein